MPPTVHLVRHAQGFHNLCDANTVLRDPLLTPEGNFQCGQLQQRFPHHAGVELIVSSPIRRTIYTSLMGFSEDIKKKNITIIALPELQETSDLPCDTGLDPEELVKEFAGKPVDLSLVRRGWNIKKGKWSTEPHAISERARVAREWLRDRQEKEIVVVTHGSHRPYHAAIVANAFATATETGYVWFMDKNRFPGTGWANTEFRSYHVDDSSPHHAQLIETEDSKSRRVAKPLDHTEVTQLKRTLSKEAADKIEEANKEATTEKSNKGDHTESAATLAKNIQSKV
ncbi:hypothetical protein Q7P37_000911 [Cladosporium fusiforme]